MIIIIKPISFSSFSNLYLFYGKFLINVLGDDQDLDDRAIRQLWDENQELRDQVNQMRTNVGDQGDEGVLIIYQIFAYHKKKSPGVLKKGDLFSDIP